MKYNIWYVLLFLPSLTFSSGDWHWSNPVPPGNALYAVHVFDSLNILAMGEAGIILRSADFGRTWKPKYDKNITKNIYGSHFLIGKMA